MTERHGGNLKHLAALAGLPAGEILDFSANINPLGPPEWLRSLISAQISSVVHYPDPHCSSLAGAISARYGVEAEEVLVGNGSSEILYLLPRALQKGRAVIPVPAYVDYAHAAELSGTRVEKWILREADGFVPDLSAIETCLRGDEVLLIGQPNNPTGLFCDGESLRGLASRNGSTIFIVDEAFADFVEGIDRLTVHRPSNVVVLCSFTKIFAIPGIRLGCMIADPDIIRQVRKLMPPWSVNTFAQAVGEAALRDEEYVRRSRAFVQGERERLSQELRSISGLTVYPGQANFLLVRIDRKEISAPLLAQRLLSQGIAVRLCENFDGLDSRFFRIAVKTREENLRLCESLRAVLGLPPRVAAKRKRPAVMLQGTSSNAGKSVLAAALCRILLQDGFRVAPFKAQNMSLNSYVARSGGEMGRAQVVQAQACRLEPDVRMNPILLKPNSDTGSQVIVMGKAVGNMDVQDYIRYKPHAFAAAKEAFDSLAEEHDVMVLEGAGSPAEINLKHHDIVNMNMARHARSPVLLVGDIDRGGVFSAFVGTMEVLAEWERALVAGFVINRFRGDEALLRDAIDYTERHAGRPVFGVVPYLERLGLPEEDSVTFKNSILEGSRFSSGEGIEIAVIDLPHISNFTDFDPLRFEPDVNLRIVRASGDLGQPDAVILPGSKNVMGDLEYLQRTGLAQGITDLTRGEKTELIGICGGLQFLGREIADPHGIESGGRTLRSLGLLPLSTTLAPEKTLQCVTARHLESGLAVRGYEIHHGKMSGTDLIPSILREDGAVIGVKSADGLLWGTYLHGIFDADEFRRWFIDRLRIRRGLSSVGCVCSCYNLEPAFDRLAETVRRSLRIDVIYRLMGLR